MCKCQRIVRAMTDIVSARDGRLPIAQPANRIDCEAADGIGLRVASPEGPASPRTRPRWAFGAQEIWGEWTITPHSEVSHLNSVVVSAPLGRPCGRAVGDLWADPLEIRSEWYSSTAPIAANSLTSRRRATTYKQSEHGGDRLELPLRRF